MAVECTYVSAGCNQSPNCLALNGNVALYASCNALVLAMQRLPSLPYEVLRTFVAHEEEVTSVRWIDSQQFLTTSVDKSVVIWQISGEDATVSVRLDGHQEAVSVASGIVRSNGITVASASGDSTIRVWAVREGQIDAIETIDLHSGLAMDLKLCCVGNDSLVLFAALDDCKVHMFVESQDGRMERKHVLHGHEDWIRSLDVFRMRNDLLLSSGGQDGFIRVWRFSHRSSPDERSLLETAKDDDEDITMKEEIITIEKENIFFAVSLETVLAGHEDKVFSVQWKHGGASCEEDPCLLSCSLDKSLIVWSPPAPGTSDGVWTESVRLGEVGGNVLGFIGAQYSTVHDQLLAYSFHGAFHHWVRHSEGIWRPQVSFGGHFRSVADLDWEEQGRYVISVSADQTTRIHAPWRLRDSPDGRVLWREIARPQVHGYDLNTVTMLPDHKMASGADEKIVRVFESTRSFLENLSSITGLEVETKMSKVAQGASVPSLGLSNKAVFEDESQVADNERHVKDQYPDHYFKPETYSEPPPEESLLQNTLWPELKKLYGHGYDIFSLASDPRGSLLASACKASKAEHAEIILWEAQGFKIHQRLAGHNLTVTRMAFSPCGRFLLSVSRDRTWCLFEKKAEDNCFVKVAATDKKTSVHQRIIWDCSWSADSTVFMTCSRDKKLAAWAKTGSDNKEASCLGNYGIACKSPLTLAQSVTAVAVAPVKTSDGRYLIGCGLENGSICLIKWRKDPVGTEEEWDLLETLDCARAHHKAVKRLKFRLLDDNDDGGNGRLLLASCSDDHSVRIFTVFVREVQAK